MHNIPLPAYTMADVLDACITTITDDVRRLNLENARQAICSQSAEYLKRAACDDLFAFPQKDAVTEHVGKEEMVWLYEERFIKCVAARPMYTHMRAGGIGGKCALCSARDAQTLDHYLPKGKYCALAVTPANLVPACFTCNNDKNSKIAASVEEMPIHPYFTSVGELSWLAAEYEKSTPVAFRFFVDEGSVQRERAACDASSTKLLLTRIKNTFYGYKLDELYATNAAQQVSRASLRYANHPYAQDEIARDASTCEQLYGKNYWETVFWKTLLQDRWFIEQLTT